MKSVNRYLGNIAILIAGMLTAWAEPEKPEFSGEQIDAHIHRLLEPDRAARLKACEFLATWVEQQPEHAKARFLDLIRKSEEPEIRERCLQLLKPVAAREFGHFGEGYMGISMGDALMIQVPGEAQARCGLVINSTSKDSPAEKAGLQQGDVIVFLNKHFWRDGSTIVDLQQGLSAKIRATGAGKVANLGIWRKNELLQVDVLLTRRPGNIDQMEMQLMPNGGIRINEEELKRAVELEKNSNAYFAEWLEKQLATQPVR